MSDETLKIIIGIVIAVAILALGIFLVSRARNNASKLSAGAGDKANQINDYVQGMDIEDK